MMWVLVLQESEVYLYTLDSHCSRVHSQFYLVLAERFQFPSWTGSLDLFLSLPNPNLVRVCANPY